MAPSAAASAALVVVLATPGALRTALDHYEFGDYAVACEQLERLRGEGGLARDDQVEVLRHLGACHHFLGREAASRAAFEGLLDADPHADLDPVKFPPELVSFFRGIRDARGPAPAPAQASEKSRGMALLPFGVGQFQNDEPGKGALLASLEAVALGVGIVGLALFEAEKESGGFLAGGRFEDENKAATLQALYLGGFIGFGALWVVGAADALVRFDDGPTVSVAPAPGGFVLGGRF